MMNDLTNVLYTTSEQHETAALSQLKRDEQIFLKIQEKSKHFSPFLDEITLQNIFNGVVSHENVNVKNFFEMWSSLINKMQGKNVFKFSFKRSDKVKKPSTDKLSNSSRSIIIISTTVRFIASLYFL